MNEPIRLAPEYDLKITWKKGAKAFSLFVGSGVLGVLLGAMVGALVGNPDTVQSMLGGYGIWLLQGLLLAAMYCLSNYLKHRDR